MKNKKPDNRPFICVEADADGDFIEASVDERNGAVDVSAAIEAIIENEEWRACDDDGNYTIFSEYGTLAVRVYKGGEA